MNCYMVLAFCAKQKGWGKPVSVGTCRGGLVGLWQGLIVSVSMNANKRITAIGFYLTVCKLLQN